VTAPRRRYNEPMSTDSRVDLWYVRLDDSTDPALWQEYYELLPSDERSRAERFSHGGSRQQFLAGRALVRTVLAQYEGVDPRSLRFECNAYGKPSLSERGSQQLEFNLSHTRGLVVCAVTVGHAIGVDVENSDRTTDCGQLATRFFARTEATTLACLAPERQRAVFFEFWTLKEAFIKARGMGLSIPLDGFAFSLVPDRPPRITFLRLGDEDPGAWQFARLTLGPAYQLAVALHRGAPPEMEILVRKALPLRFQEPGRLLPKTASNTWAL